MINKDQMTKSILKASPSFQQTWDAFREEWKNENEGLPLYLTLSDLARYLISMLQNGETESFP